MNTETIDPATLTYCPCGRQIQPDKDYDVCRPCWLSAPAYWRILFSKKTSSEFQRNRALNQILLHARRRAQ